MLKICISELLRIKWRFGYQLRKLIVLCSWCWACRSTDPQQVQHRSYQMASSYHLAGLLCYSLDWKHLTLCPTERCAAGRRTACCIILRCSFIFFLRFILRFVVSITLTRNKECELGRIKATGGNLNYTLTVVLKLQLLTTRNVLFYVPVKSWNGVWWSLYEQWNKTVWSTTSVVCVCRPRDKRLRVQTTSIGNALQT